MVNFVLLFNSKAAWHALMGEAGAAKLATTKVMTCPLFFTRVLRIPLWFFTKKWEIGLPLFSSKPDSQSGEWMCRLTDYSQLTEL